MLKPTKVPMKPRVRGVLLFGLAGALAIFFGLSMVYQLEISKGQERSRSNATIGEYDPQQVVPAYPAIIRPTFVTAKQAADKIAPNELVLGVAINGKTRAYPINMLTGPQREIFNDELGGTAIAATW